MARKQYRIYTPGDWTSNFGFSFVAIQNVSGSGKKITLRQLEMQVLSPFSSNISAAPCTMYRCAAPMLDGQDMALASVRMDTAVSVPAGVTVRRGGTATSYTSRIGRVDVAKRNTTAANLNDPRFQQTQFGFKRLAGILKSPIKQTAVEPHILRNGEALAVVSDTQAAMRASPVRVGVVLSIDGKTVFWDFIANPVPGFALASIENTHSTAVVEVLQITLAEVGTADTPTIRVVPIGQLRAGDLSDTAKQNLVAMPMDTADGDLSTSVCSLYSDVGFQPFGVPEVYITPGSTGSPKDMNYLHTRDFAGPMYRNFLPEIVNVRDAAPDTLGMFTAQRWSDLLMRRKSSCPASGIVLNPGEGVALVSSAETAVGTQAAWSGWPMINFGAVIDVEPQYSPTLTLTGLQNPTEVRIYDAGTTTLIAGQETITSGSFSWQYDPDTYTSVDIAILSLGYQNIRLTNFALSSSSDSTVPIQQQIDRQYSN